MSTTVFYLVRHAHARWTPDEDRPLSQQGQRDALRVAGALAQLPLAALYSSPARRARQTIAPLAARLGLPVYLEPALCERRLSAEPVDDFEGAVRVTWENPAFAFPGGESNAEAQERAVRLVCRLLGRHEGEQVVLSTHGNLLALLLRHFCPTIDHAFWQALAMPDIYRLAVEGHTMAGLQRWLGHPTEMAAAGEVR